MRLRRNGNGPYAPRPPGGSVDWRATMSTLDETRRQIAAEEETARANIAAFHRDADPFSQLVKRAHAQDERITALTTQVLGLTTQVRLLIDKLSETE